MDYTNIYKTLVKKAQKENRSTKDNVWYEKHHIKPKSLFPSLAKEPSNLVLFTPREHYVAHRLLTKVYPGTSMNYAFLNMCNKACNNLYSRTYKVNARAYEQAKFFFQQNNPAKTPEARKKISKKKAGSKHHYYNCKPEDAPGFKKELIVLEHKSGKILTGTRSYLYKNTELTPANVSNLITGYRKTAKGWRLAGTEIPKYPQGRYSTSADHTIYSWYNKKTKEVLTCSRWDFIEATGLKARSVGTLITKTRQSLFNWSILT